MSLNDNPCCIYVIAATNGLVKIGISNRPNERFNNLKSSSPVSLTLVHVCPVKSRAALLESEIHRRMVAVRSHGEWFQALPSEAIKIVDEIAGPWMIEPPEVDPAVVEWKRRNTERIDAGKSLARFAPRPSRARHNPVKP